MLSFGSTTWLAHCRLQQIVRIPKLSGVLAVQWKIQYFDCILPYFYALRFLVFFLCKVFLLTCVRRLNYRPETCSIHFKVTNWIKINLSCVRLKNFVFFSPERFISKRSCNSLSAFRARNWICTQNRVADVSSHSELVKQSLIRSLTHSRHEAVQSAGDYRQDICCADLFARGPRWASKCKREPSYHCWRN
jgi:hypothetical protein